MKRIVPFFMLGLLLVGGGFKYAPYQGENVEFSCIRVHKATNTCHFNFIIDGAKYRYVDMGCKYNKKRDEVIKKAKAGTLALARDWKIDCVGKEKDSQ